MLEDSIDCGWITHNTDVYTFCGVDYCKFGDTVTTICYLLNKNSSLPYDFDYPKYIKEIKLCYESKIVKMADTIANLEASILSGELKRVNKYSKQLSLLTEV
jgi:hypothetical protein